MFMDKKFLKMRDGAELYVELKESDGPVWIVCTHGIGEHLGRHKYIPELFGHDFNVFQYDLRGHGRSSGKRAWVSSFSDYMEDLKEIIRFLEEKYRMKRYILFGHSMGALISSAFIQNYVEEERYPEQLVINAPPCGASGLLGQILKIVPPSFFKTLCSIPYSIPLAGLIELDDLSHDPRVREDYLNDELCLMKFHSKLIFELIKTAQDTFTRPLRSKCPSFVTVGSLDRVVGANEVINYFTTIDRSFNLKVFDGAYHEIHNEIEKYHKSYFEYLKTLFRQVPFYK